MIAVGVGPVGLVLELHDRRALRHRGGRRGDRVDLAAVGVNLQQRLRHALARRGQELPHRVELPLRERARHVGGLVLAPLRDARSVEPLGGEQPGHALDVRGSRGQVVVAHRRQLRRGRGKPGADLAREVLQAPRFAADVLGGQHDLCRGGGVLREMQQGEQPGVGTAGIAVGFEEAAVGCDERRERVRVEVLPVPRVVEQMRLGRRLRQLAKPEAGDDAEVPAPAAEVRPQQLTLGRIGAVPADGGQPHGAVRRHVDELDRVQVVHGQAVQP